MEEDTRRARFTQQLGAVGVTPEMNKRVRQYMKAHKIGLAEFIRLAIKFFFEHNS